LNTVSIRARTYLLHSLSGQAATAKMSTAGALSSAAEWEEYDNLRRKFFSTTLQDYTSVADYGAALLKLQSGLQEIGYHCLIPVPLFNSHFMDGLGSQFQPWREAYKIRQPIGFAPDDGGYSLDRALVAAAWHSAIAYEEKLLREGTLETKDGSLKGVAAYEQYIWRGHPADECVKACLCCAVDASQQTTSEPIASVNAAGERRRPRGGAARRRKRQENFERLLFKDD
jgi:hypothetical protein